VWGWFNGAFVETYKPGKLASNRQKGFERQGIFQELPGFQGVGENMTI